MVLNKYLYMIEGEGEFEGLIDKITKNDIVIETSLSETQLLFLRKLYKQTLLKERVHFYY